MPALDVKAPTDWLNPMLQVRLQAASTLSMFSSGGCSDQFLDRDRFRLAILAASPNKASVWTAAGKLGGNYGDESTYKSGRRPSTTLNMTSFNSSFYATAAVVIPVLFLAWAIQGDLLTKAMSLSGRLNVARRRSYIGGPKPHPLTTLAEFTLLFVGIGSLVFSTWAEVVALVDLDLRASTHTDNAMVLGVSAGLVVLTASAGLVQILRNALTDEDAE